MMYVIPQVSWFAVFDGHAGSRVSAHCARHLLDCIVTSEDFKRAIKNEGTLSQDELFSKVSTSEGGSKFHNFKHDLDFEMIETTKKLKV